MYGPASGTWPVSVTSPVRPSSVYERRQRGRVLGGEPVGVAPDDDRVHPVPAFAQQRLRSEQPVLPLPGLQATDQADDGDVRRELAAAAAGSCSRGTGAPAPTTNVRRDREEPRLRARGGARVAADRRRRERVAQPSSQLLLGGIACCHHTTRSGMPASIAAGDAVQLCFRGPIEDQIRLAAARHARQAKHRRSPSGAASRRRPAASTSTRKPAAASAVRPAAGLEEHELELDALPPVPRRAPLGASPQRLPTALPMAPLSECACSVHSCQVPVPRRHPCVPDRGGHPTA